MKEILTLLVIVLLPALLVAQGDKTAQSSSIIFNHGNVIDVTGAPSESDMTVIVTGNQISAIGKTGKVRVPKNARLIDASGKFLILREKTMQTLTAGSFLNLEHDEVVEALKFTARRFRIYWKCRHGKFERRRA